MDMLMIAAFAAEQLIHETNEMRVSFVLTSFGPIVEIEPMSFSIPLDCV